MHEAISLFLSLFNFTNYLTVTLEVRIFVVELMQERFQDIEAGVRSCILRQSTAYRSGIPRSLKTTRFPAASNRVNS